MRLEVQRTSAETQMAVSFQSELGDSYPTADCAVTWFISVSSQFGRIHSFLEIMPDTQRKS